MGIVIVRGHDIAGIHGHGLYRFHVGHGRDLVRRWRDAGGPLAYRWTWRAHRSVRREFVRGRSDIAEQYPGLL